MSRGGPRSRASFLGALLFPLLAPGASSAQPVAIVQAEGKPGHWRFELGLSADPGSLRVIAGEAVLVTADSIGFRFKGRPGERVVFTFRARR